METEVHCLKKDMLLINYEARTAAGITTAFGMAVTVGAL